MSAISVGFRQRLDAAVGTKAQAEPAILCTERFHMLDAWRGLAALAVVLHHAGGALNPAFKIGEPAVMIFFVISGYCIAAAADAARRKGMGFGRFMFRRIRRIYPPYFFSLLFVIGCTLAKEWLVGKHELSTSPTFWLQNFTLTQWASLVGHPLTYAWQNHSLGLAAYWSLGYEEQFYLVFGVLLIIAGTWMRQAVVGLIAASVLWIAFFPSAVHGVFIEYFAMFGIGALVFYRLCRVREVWLRQAIDSALVLTVVGSVLARFAMLPHGHEMTWTEWMEPSVRVAWGDLAIAAGFGLLLVWTRKADGWYQRNQWLSLPLGALGAVTYSLYLVHQANLGAVAMAATKALGIVGMHEPPLWASLTIQSVLHLCVAAVFWYFCERPFLNKPLKVTRTEEARADVTVPAGNGLPALAAA